jgi:TetR/AcrR family transcriptional regulator, tetracycline repressor protein
VKARSRTVKARGRPLRDSAAALSRERIVRAALEIVDHGGLSALSMRRLGASLGVDPMAIYHHLPRKEALYDAIVEAVMSDMDFSETPRDGSPLERLASMARGYTRALLAHPNAIPVVASRPVRTPRSLRPIEQMLALIRELGFSPARAMIFIDVCGHFITGYAQTYAAHVMDSEMHRHEPVPLDQLPREEFPNIHEVMENRGGGDPFAVEFEIGLDALLRGLLGMDRS